MRDWEQTFSSWSRGPGQTEEQRISNGISQIKSAIMSHSGLKNRGIDVFVQGSYRNRVNVRSESDIDIGVICTDTFFPQYPEDGNIKNLLKEDLSDSNYNYQTFKNEIEEALVTKFGRASVIRGNKAFDIKENSYRVEADVAAFFEHRRYTSRYNYSSGVELRPDNALYQRVINWPEQHYENGVSKNDKTNRFYKRTTRVLKKLAYEMSDNKIIESNSIPGFLVECLSWNIPNTIFTTYTSYYERVKQALIFLYNQTKDEKNCIEWGEVSEFKYLFKGSHPWTIESVNKFINQAWNYVGY